MEGLCITAKKTSVSTADLWAKISVRGLQRIRNSKHWNWHAMQLKGTNRLAVGHSCNIFGSEKISDLEHEDWVAYYLASYISVLESLDVNGTAVMNRLNKWKSCVEGRKAETFKRTFLDEHPVIISRVWFGIWAQESRILFSWMWEPLEVWVLFCYSDVQVDMAALQRWTSVSHQLSEPGVSNSVSTDDSFREKRLFRGSSREWGTP
jgi:hypothetical protein